MKDYNHIERLLERFYNAETSEREEQELLFQWAELKRGMFPDLELMFHIPNGGSRNVIEAKNLKKQGVKPGVPDICLPVPRWGWHGLFIELKRQKGGRATPEQLEYIEDLKDQGYAAEICHGFDEASKFILDYLEGRL